MRIFSFVAASSNSGKTTLIEKIVPLLKGRGLSVAVVKHASKGFDIDRPGKDSWRFREAGADAILLAGPDGLALQKRLAHTPSLEELAAMLSGADVVLGEGFKKDAPNKIEVFRSGISADRPLCLSDDSFIALASDRRFELSLPCFDLDDAAGIAGFIAGKL